MYRYCQVYLFELHNKIVKRLCTKMYDITGSIVLYENEEEVVKKAINSFLYTDLNVRLYLIDNSSTDKLKSLRNIDKNRIEYIFNNANLGFGKAHNIAIKKVIDKSKYHAIINPDMWFEKNTLEKMYFFMEKNKNVGLLMPKMLYPDNSVQYTARRLPSPLDLIIKRFFPERLKKWSFIQKRINWYELRNYSYKDIMEVPCIPGGFMFVRTKVFKEVGLFDERFFMYLEDFDLSRRIGEKYKTVLFPHAIVYHEYTMHSYKNKKLLMIHIISAIKYFNKWGWFFDKKRKEKNKEVKIWKE